MANSLDQPEHFRTTDVQESSLAARL